MQALPFPSTARSSDLGRDTMLPDSLLAVVSRLHQTRTPPTPRPTPPYPAPPPIFEFPLSSSLPRKFKFLDFMDREARRTEPGKTFSRNKQVKRKRSCCNAVTYVT